MGLETHMAVYNRRQPGGDSTFERGSDFIHSGHAFPMAAKAAGHVGIVNTIEIRAKREVVSLPLSHLDDAPGGVVVDDVDDRQSVTPGRIQA